MKLMREMDRLFALSVEKKTTVKEILISDDLYQVYVKELFQRQDLTKIGQEIFWKRHYCNFGIFIPIKIITNGTNYLRFKTRRLYVL